MQPITKLALFAIAAILSGCESLPTKSQMAGADYGETPIQESTIRAATKIISKQLIDPYSAKIDCKSPMKVALNKAFENRYGYLTACYVNAKNRFGAYTGINEYYFWSRDRHIEAIELPFDFTQAEE